MYVCKKTTRCCVKNGDHESPLRDKCVPKQNNQLEERCWCCTEVWLLTFVIVVGPLCQVVY